MQIAKHRKILDRLLAERENHEQAWNLERISVQRLKHKLLNHQRALKIAQDVAMAVQLKAHEKIAGVVTRCLKAVFPRPYEFQIKFETKRGKTDARMAFVRNGHEMSPQDGVGGSVLDVASFALRLACLCMQKPRRRKVVFIDEGFGGVSNEEDNKERLRTLLEVISKELGFQIVQVTHDDGLKAGTILRIK